MQVVALFHPKAKKWVEGRRGLLQQLAQEVPSLVGTKPVAWFHAASLGEFEQGRPVIEEFKKQHPDYFVLLTFFSPSGYEVRKNYAEADYVCYLPVDTPANAKQFVALFAPRIAFFIKYEFWQNYLTELRKQNALIISFSAIFRPSQVFFKWYGASYRQTLHLFDHLFVQNKQSVQLLNSIGITNVTHNGDTRFDRVLEIAANRKPLPEIAAFVKDCPCLVVGSAWEADMEEVILPYLSGRLTRDSLLKVIIAPHEIKHDSLVKWETSLPHLTIRYSEYKNANFDTACLANKQVLLIDNIGMLSSLYQFATIAYIGGAFGKGLHNILEAATYGIPVFFGSPNYKKFQEALDLLALGGAFSVANEEAFSRDADDLFVNVNQQKAIRTITTNYIQEQSGAVLPILELVAQKVAVR